MTVVDLDSILQQAISQLDAFSTARLDAELLLATVLQKPRSFLRAFPETELVQQQRQQFQALLARRVAGEPLAYILGEKEFFGLPFKVTQAVLIPRPDTELLVELALASFAADPSINVCELGTGSGAIALALASQRPRWQILAVDNSRAALAIAKENAIALKLSQVDFMYSDWLQSVPPQKFAMIVSNPPYIATDDPALEKNVARYEDHSALIAEDNGLADLKSIAQQAREHLQPDGKLLLEHGYQQGEAVATYLQSLAYINVQTCNDLSGLPRVTVGQY